MSGFIATGTTESDAVITNNGFFPDLSVEEFRQQMRITNTVPDDRVMVSMRNAMIETNRELTVWEAAQKNAGIETLEEVPCTHYGELTEKEHFYYFAVFNRTASELQENYRGYDSTLSGHQRSDQMEPTIDHYQREYRESLRQLKDQPRTTVELL